MAKLFVHLRAVIKVASRKARHGGWRLPSKPAHTAEVLEQAFNQFGALGTINVDEGRQFTASEFTEAVPERGCKLSMDGQGACRDSVFVE